MPLHEALGSAADPLLAAKPSAPISMTMVTKTARRMLSLPMWDYVRIIEEPPSGNKSESETRRSSRVSSLFTRSAQFIGPTDRVASRFLFGRHTVSRADELGRTSKE